MNIKTKIYIVFSISTTILLLLLSYVLISYIYQTITDSRVNSLDAIATIQESRINNYLDNISETTTIFSNDKILIESINNYNLKPSDKLRNSIISKITEFKNIDVNYLDISIIDTVGMTVASTDDNQNYTTVDKNFDNKSTSKDSYAKYVNIEDKGYLYNYKKIHDNNGQVIGSLVLKESINNLDIVASDYTGLGNTGETVIGVKNNEGNVLFINNLRNESAKISNLDTSNRSIIRALNGTESTFTDTIDYRDIKVFSATRYIDDTKWGIVVKQDRSEVLAPVYLAETAILAIFLLIWISIFVLIKWIIKMVFGPLKKIEDGINIIKNGDLDHRFNFTDKNEMSRLADSFNEMTDSLQEARKSVDHKVYTQTKDIINQSEKLQNQQSAVLNILEDIEDEKFKAEQLADDLIKFQMAVEGASDHIVITNPDGVIIFANHGAEIISGFSKSEMIGKKAGSSELWGGQMSDDIYKKFWQTIKIDKKPYSGIFDNKKKSGKLYEAAATVAPIVNDANEVIYYVGIERDVTKEKEIDKAKTEFVSLASHQLRTPLSAINWYTEMLLDGDAGEISKQQKMYLDEIYRGNQRMVELVNSLLNVSRLDLGTFEIKPQLIELAPVIDDIINEMKHTLLDKKQKIVNKIHDDFPKISVDPKLIRVIIQNLISNAIKYSPINGIITVTVSYHPKNINSAYEINIADSGYGIPSNQKDLIFTKLFRADNIREMDTEGTGLGLYIVKSILDEAGGGISFNSVENKGTTFTVTLPISGMKQKSGNKTIE